MTKRVLLVGGPKHGQWVEVERKAWDFRVMRPVHLLQDIDYDNLDTRALLPTMEYDQYHFERVPIQFEGLRTVVTVGIHQDLRYGSMEKTRLVASAIFQRDIVETMSADPWDEWA